MIHKTIETSAVTDATLPKVLDGVCQQIREFFKERQLTYIDFQVYKTQRTEVDGDILRNIEPYNNKHPICDRMNSYLSVTLNPIKIIDEPAVIPKQEKTPPRVIVPVDPQPSLNAFITASTRFDPSSLHLESIKKIATELDAKYNQFLELPESHPNYNNEWRSWYVQGKKAAAKGIELQEWNKFWKNRTYRMKLEEFQKMEAELREKEKLEEKEKSEDEGELVIDESMNITPGSPVAIQQQEAETEKEDECVIVEMERVMIEVSDEEDETQQPKRQKVATESSGESSSSAEVPSPPQKQTSTERQRMTIAVQIAYQMIKDNRDPEPEEVGKLVKSYFGEAESDENDVEDGAGFDFSELSNDDMIILYKNFQKMTVVEQDTYMDALAAIEKAHPERYQFISQEVKMLSK